MRESVIVKDCQMPARIAMYTWYYAIRQFLNGTDIAGLGLGCQLTHLHIFDLALTQWADALMNPAHQTLAFGRHVPPLKRNFTEFEMTTLGT